VITPSLDVPRSDVDRVLAAGAPPRVAIILGSGLAGLAEAVSDPVLVSYDDLEGPPKVEHIPGHAGTLVLGEIEGVPVVLFKGRFHLYQGVSASDAAWPTRMAAALGCEILVVTNASGGVAERLRTGDIVLISDHLNLLGTSPLVGCPWPEGGTLFVGMRDAYDPDLRALAYAAAAEEDVAVREGVYAALIGPNYETPAEVAHLRNGGADVVGMSTVPEVIAARALGLRVLGISLVANDAAGEGLAHEEVLEAGRFAAGDLTRLMLAILRGL
jgi:inosine/guanosine/xanthosine phosphorylase family protein